MGHADHAGKPSRVTTSLKNLNSGNEGLKFTRVEMKAGSVHRAESTDHEKYVLVLSGSCRLHLPEGPVALGPLEMLRIPAEVKHAHEALEDTVLLSGKHARKPSRRQEVPLEQDNDQYLWGV